MKKPVLTARLHLIYVFPVIIYVLPAEAISRRVIPPAGGMRASQIVLRMTAIDLEAVVHDQDNYKSGELQGTIHLNEKPEGPLKLIVEMKERKEEEEDRRGNVAGHGKPGLRSVGAPGGNATGMIRHEFTLTDSVFAFSLPVSRPKLWSAEIPNLYIVSIRLSDSSGGLNETLAQEVGFRKIIIRNGVVAVNGQPVWIRGVSYSGAGPSALHTASRDSMLKEIRLLKQFNVNAVRTADHPGDADWDKLCDEYGLYIIDEGTPAGAGGTGGVSGTAGRSRQHPSLIAWSSGDGLAPAMEYERVEGNSLGGFKDHLDKLYASRPGFQGGFIGDPGTRLMTGPDGRPSPAAWEMKKCYQPVRTVLTAGGGIRVFNDYFFRNLSNISLEWEILVNGRSRQKGALSVLSVLPRQSGSFHLPLIVPGGKEEVFLDIRYKVRRKEPLMPAGFVIASEQFLLRKGINSDLAVLPDGELTFKDEGGLFTISSPSANLQFNKQTGWLQHYVVNGNALLEEPKGSEPGDSAGSGPGEEPAAGLSANFWRAPTDLDRAAGYPLTLAAWKRSTKEPRLQLFSTSTASDIVIVKADYALPETQCILHIHYTVNARGELQVEQSMEADTTQGTGSPGGPDTLSGAPQSTVPGAGTAGSHRPMLPRYGMKWILPAGYDSITWYGRGPHENYQDRSCGAETGVYRQTVDEQFFAYRHPQETGTKTGIRWWKMTDKQGHGLLITADSSFLSISALHYYDSDLDPDSAQIKQPRSAGALQPRPQTQLNIDYRQMGIGGDHLSGMPPSPAYLLKNENYTYQFKVTPL